MHMLPDQVKGVIYDMNKDQDFKDMAEEVLKWRDRAIVGCFTEIVVSTASIMLYDLRRSIIIPIINMTLTVLSMVGLHGALLLNVNKIQAHGVITTGLLIASVLNFFCEALFTHAGLGSDTLPGWLVLTIMMVPYSLNLFCSGLSLVLLSKLQALIEAEDATSGTPSDEQLQRQVQEMRGSDLCCVCMDKRKDAVFTPCGHRAVCHQCGELLRSKSRHCPICRYSIDSVVRVWDT